MLEDILLINDNHKKAAVQILNYVLKHRKDRMIVGISGESGSGKSELTHVLAKLLGKEGILTKTVHADNFYKTLPEERKEKRLEKGIENAVGPQEYDWDAINRSIDDFKHGRISEMPCVDLITDKVDRLTTDFKEVEMIILDGLYAIKSDKVDLKVFIDLTYLETKEKHTKDSRGKEVMDEVRWAILGQEHKMVEALKTQADLLVTKEYEVIVA